jgi:hypothetical protein
MPKADIGLRSGLSLQVNPCGVVDRNDTIVLHDDVRWIDVVET